jgi:hypothetical protein
MSASDVVAMSSADVVLSSHVVAGLSEEADSVDSHISVISYALQLQAELKRVSLPHFEEAVGTVEIEPAG